MTIHQATLEYSERNLSSQRVDFVQDWLINAEKHFSNYSAITELSTRDRIKHEGMVSI